MSGKIEVTKTPMLPVSWTSAKFIGTLHKENMAKGFKLVAQEDGTYKRKDGTEIQTVVLKYDNGETQKSYSVTPQRSWRNKEQ